VNRQFLIALLMTALILSAGASHMLLAQTKLTVATGSGVGSGTASQMIEQGTRRIFDTLSTRRAEFSRDHDALRAFVVDELDTIFDRTYSARMVLGRHARGADEADIVLFADALTDHLLQRYGALLVDFNTQLSTRIKSERELPRNVGVQVSTELIRPGEAPIALDYLLRKHNEQWKVFDVIVEGVSMVQTFRQQFDAELQRKSIRNLTSELSSGQRQAPAG